MSLPLGRVRLGRTQRILCASLLLILLSGALLWSIVELHVWHWLWTSSQSDACPMNWLFIWIYIIYIIYDIIYLDILLYGLLERWSCQPHEWQPMAEDQLTNSLSFSLSLAETLKLKQMQIINHHLHIILLRADAGINRHLMIFLHYETGKFF